jgi:hypothetical protein
VKTIIVSALAFTAMASAALADAPNMTAADASKASAVATAPAEPMQLTDAQLGQITAGQNYFIPIIGQGGAGACQRCRSGGGDGTGLVVVFPY